MESTLVTGNHIDRVADMVEENGSRCFSDVPDFSNAQFDAIDNMSARIKVQDLVQWIRCIAINVAAVG
jgi:hypothetical protein